MIPYLLLGVAISLIFILSIDKKAFNGDDRLFILAAIIMCLLYPAILVMAIVSAARKALKRLEDSDRQKLKDLDKDR
jgi:hypothetical protein